MVNAIMTVRPPERQKELLRRFAGRKGMTVNQLVIAILWDWLEKEQAKERRKA